MKLPFDSTAMTVYLTATGAWVAIALMFVLGAAIGSFLNVVAYRLPRGMSLSRPGSRCPACGHPIRWHDNVPIFGWLMLGGRCRDCRAAISPRYPLVELLVAIAGAAVIWAGLEPIAGAQSADAFAVEPLPLVFQLLLVDTLICAALLEFDGHRAPPRLLVAVLVAGVGLAVVWTGMLVAGETVGWALYDSATTLAAALLLGALAWPLLVHEGNDAIATGGTRVVELALVGAILGLTPLAAIAVFAQVLFVATRLAGRFWAPAARFRWAGGLVMGTLIWIVAGREIDARLPSAIRDDSLATLLAAGSIVAVLSIVVWATRPADAERSSVAGEHD